MSATHLRSVIWLSDASFQTVFVAWHWVAMIILIVTLLYVAVVCPVIRAIRMRAAFVRFKDSLPPLCQGEAQATLGRIIHKIKSLDRFIAAGSYRIRQHAPNEPHESPTDSNKEKFGRIGTSLSLDVKSVAISGADIVLSESIKLAHVDIAQSWVRAGDFLREHPDKIIDIAAEAVKTTIDPSGTPVAELVKQLVHAAESRKIDVLHHGVTAGVVAHGVDSVPDHVQNISAEMDLHQAEFTADVSVGADAVGSADNVPDASIVVDAGGADVVGTDVFPFPLITLLRSLWKEASLAAEGKTTLDYAMKHVALDVLGTASGGAIGAAVGTLILPGIGTLLGGLVGGMVGRVTTNHIKFQPYMKAKQEYEAAYDTMKQECAQSVAEWCKAYKETASSLRSRYCERFSEFDLASEGYELELKVDRLIESLASEFAEMANEIRKRGEHTVQAFRNEWLTYVGMGIQRKLNTAISVAENDEKLRTESFDLQIAKCTGVMGKLSTLQRTVSPSKGNFTSEVVQFAKEVDEFLEQYVQKFRIWADASTVSHAVATSELARLFKHHRERHDGLLDKWEQRLRPLERELRREADRLGG
jgi:hypothetical protein